MARILIAQVCAGLFIESGPGFWAPPQQTGVRRAPTRQAGGHCLEVRWKPKAARGCSGVAVC
ncbi:unnamed protein product [Staurois parvus]|uniref:Uncharacterized protein n=1 Tax=Staurois parvus TaxID=386267 RepID=A0ABN9CNP3_9NEOB|nr:unnamed protein product [Staurois parvus]